MSSYLYYTIHPVLLGESTSAGRLAKAIRKKYRLTSHWFGVGYHLGLTAYAKRHPLPQPLRLISRPLLLQILLDHAKEQSADCICAILPCDKDAENFLLRQKEALDPFYVILPLQSPVGDPLASLIHETKSTERTIIK